MSVKAADPADVVVCAEWLHTSLPAWLTTDDAAERCAALQRLTEWLERVSVLASDGCCCLPVRQALRVQVAAQDSWNATASTAGWPQECTALRLQIRWLATHLFLLSHCAFAVRGVAVAHMTHHLHDAEKCIVMCLKTGKELALAGRAAEADKVLAWAAAVVAACATAPGAVVQKFAAEVHFAQLRAAWACGALDRACEVAASLAEETRDSVTYREALFEFIYDAAMGAHDSAGGGDASSTLEATKRLLCLSLRLQQETTIRTVKQRTFLGMTQMQYANVLLRASEYAAAAAAASQSYDLLRTFEPLVVRLKAEIHLHAVDELVALLRLLCGDAAVALVDLCAMTALAMRHNPAAEQRIFAELQRRVAVSHSADDQFRLLCVLTEQASEWSVGALLCLLAAETPCVATTASTETRRFLFCSLWKLACDISNTTALASSTRWRCLELALRHFAGVASAGEVQSVLLDMAHIALRTTTFRGAGALEAAALQQTLERCEGMQDALLPALRVPLLLAQSQLAFVLAESARGVAAVRALLADTSHGDAVVAACSELLVALLRACLVRQASDVAALCLTALQTQSPQTPLCVMEFAKVYAMGCLCESDATPLSDVGALLEVHVCPLLRDAALPAQEAHWWSRLLWYVADGAADTVPTRATRLLHLGILLHPTDAALSGARAEPTKLLRGRLAALLDAEFDAFAGGTAILEVADLETQRQRLTALLSEDEANDGVLAQRVRVSLFLAHLETSLRAMAELSSTGAGDVEALHLPELLDMPAVCPADLEQAASVCDAAAAAAAARGTPAAPTALADAALALMLASAERQVSSVRATSATATATTTTTAATGALLSTLYGAYRMARTLDGRLRVCETVTGALSHLQSRSEAAPDAADEQRPLDLAAVAEARLVETVVDFFAVEAWNESVQWNVLQRRHLVERWRSAAVTLAEFLGESNSTRTAIRDLAEQMPLL